MRKYLIGFVLAFVTSPLFAGISNVTATITDADAQTWNNGTFQVSFVPVQGTPISAYNVNGASFPLSATGSMNGAGVLTVALTDLSTITPLSGQWRFQLCPNASAGCQAVLTNAVVGGAPNLSAQLSAGLLGPRFGGSNFSYGYLDIEVGTPAAPLFPGAEYFNVTSLVTREWTGSAWITIGGSGGTTINPTNNFLPKRSNATTFVDSAVDDGATAAGRVSISETVNLPLLRVNSALPSAVAAARMEEHSTSSSKSIFIQMVHAAGGGAGGGVPSITQLVDNGTESVPVAIVSGQALMKISGGGYDGTATACVLTGYCETAEIIATPDENFDGTHHGTHIDFFTTSLGSAAGLNIKSTLDPSGNWLPAGNVQIPTTKVYQIGANTGMSLGDATNGRVAFGNGTVNDKSAFAELNGVTFGGSSSNADIDFNASATLDMIPAFKICWGSANPPSGAFDTCISRNTAGVTQFGTTTSNSAGTALAKFMQISTILTVATLPTCNAGAEGTWSAVSDATAPSYNAALTGGGAIHVPVYCNGSAWTSH